MQPGSEDLTIGRWRPIRRVAHVRREFDRIRSYVTVNPAAVLGDRPAGLHVRRAGLDMSRDVRFVVGDLEIGGHSVRIPLRWADARRPELFPVLDAVLTIAPEWCDGRGAARLDLAGHYRPPFGRLGAVISALGGYRLLVESVERFLAAFAERLEEELPPEVIRSVSPVVGQEEER
jgi:hypothetical protein